MEKQTTNTIESLYDTYSVMLYGIVLEICPSTKEAETVLIKTFKKVHKQNIINQASSSICVTLIKLVIQTAHEVLMPEQLKHNFKLKRFEKSPLLHQLICEQISVDDICVKHKLTPLEVSQKVREEFNSIRNLLNEKNISLKKQLNIAI